jgi:hypothetical protein
LRVFGNSRGVGPAELQRARQFAAAVRCVLLYDEFGHFYPVFRNCTGFRRPRARPA